MFELAATDTARAQLRALRESHPLIFAAVRRRLRALRDDPGGRERGRAFQLDDGTLARVATFHDDQDGPALVLVWKIEQGDIGGRIVVIAAEFTR